MHIKQILSIVLSLFLLTSIAFVAVRSQQGVIPNKEVTATEPVASETTVVTAYYFHGNTRCKTCLEIEAFTERTLTDGFAEELADGSLKLLSVNLDAPENEHFVDDFQLTTRSVVLTGTDDEGELIWKSLPQVWDWVRLGEDGFSAALSAETTQFLDAVQP